MERASHVTDSMSTFMESVGATMPQDEDLKRLVDTLRAKGGSAPSLEVLEQLGIGPIEFGRVTALGVETGFLKVVTDRNGERLELVHGL